MVKYCTRASDTRKEFNLTVKLQLPIQDFNTFRTANVFYRLSLSDNEGSVTEEMFKCVKHLLTLHCNSHSAD